MYIPALAEIESESIIGLEDQILVTGAAGFVGQRVINDLISRGFRHIKCFIRPSSDPTVLQQIQRSLSEDIQLEIIRGNLLSREDCARAVQDVAVIYHLAAGRGEKFFPDAFLNSVVTTRNLLEAVRGSAELKRLVTISSFSVYSNREKGRGGLLDESSEIEPQPHLRGDAYTFAKAKQDELVVEFGRRFGIPYVIIRPGVVYGPGNEAITGRAGTSAFGFFLHLGGGNRLPLTYVDNCAEAIVLAGLKRGVDGEVFNVVDDDLPSSRHFLQLYKKHVRPFPSIYLPHWISFLLCWLWEGYVQWSQGQLPPTFNRNVWHAYWKKSIYSNAKLKRVLGWSPTVSSTDALQRHFESCRRKEMLRA